MYHHDVYVYWLAYGCIHACVHSYTKFVEIVHVHWIMPFLEPISNIRRDHMHCRCTTLPSCMAWSRVQVSEMILYSVSTSLLKAWMPLLLISLSWQFCMNHFTILRILPSLIAKISVCEFTWLSWVVKNGLSGGKMAEWWLGHSCMTSATRQNPNFSTACMYMSIGQQHWHSIHACL